MNQRRKIKKKKRSGKEAAHTRRHGAEEQGPKREVTLTSAALEATEISRDSLDTMNKLI